MSRRVLTRIAAAMLIVWIVGVIVDGAVYANGRHGHHGHHKTVDQVAMVR